MRSSWSANRVLAVLAAASAEAAWLTLVYLAVQWMTPSQKADLGLAHFALAAGAGLLLARYLRTLPDAEYGWTIVGAVVAAAVLGVFLPSLVGSADATQPFGALLGVAVLRGSAHAELDEDAGKAARILDVGLIGLGIFWLFAALTGLGGSADFTSAAFAATITLVSASLLLLGLARLGELRVEGADRAARSRWLVMLLAISAVLLILGIPLAALLGVPVSSALAGIVGPFAPLVLLVVAAMGWLGGMLLQLLANVFPRTSNIAVPSINGSMGQVPGHLQPTTGSALDLSWLLWVLIAILAISLLALIARLLPRPGHITEPAPDVEIREAEPVRLVLPHLPHLRLRRNPRPGTPHTAVQAYRQALALLAGSAQSRAAGETPREHARRVAPAEVGPDIGRLAVDYQINVFASRPLTKREERRALDRWRRIDRASRSGAGRVQGQDRSG